MRAVSKKRAKWLREYSKMKMEADPIQTCPVCKISDVKERMDCHHPAGRSTRDKVLNFFWVCRPCHDRIHANGKWARENGFLE